MGLTVTVACRTGSQWEFLCRARKMVSTLRILSAKERFHVCCWYHIHVSEPLSTAFTETWTRCS